MQWPDMFVELEAAPVVATYIYFHALLLTLICPVLLNFRVSLRTNLRRERRIQRIWMLSMPSRNCKTVKRTSPTK